MPGLRDTLRVFARNRPSLRALWQSRQSTFERAHVIIPSDSVAGERVRLTVQAWDRYERLLGFEGAFRVESTDPDADLPTRIAFTGEERVASYPGVKRLSVAFETPGTHYVTLVREATGERFHSNPIEVHVEDLRERRYWGDIHLHSRFSDGAGSMGKGLTFGREVMALDVCAYTDHDTMGFFIPPQLQRWLMHRTNFGAIKGAVEAHHDPGAFVVLMAYEWTKQPNRGGHVNVYFRGADEAELFDSLSAETRSYEKLWSRLRRWREETGGDVLTVPHHPAEEMYPFDFSAVEYDDELAPLVEVFSQWGSSERPASAGNRMPLEMGQGEIETPGHYVQDALELGYRVGMLASADYHGPFPGHSLIHADPHLPRLAELREDGLRWGHIWRMWDEQSYPGGLTCFRAPELTRDAVFDALRDRRVYGTTQPARILVEFAVDGVRVGEDGSEVRVDGGDAEREVDLRVAGTAPIATVEVVKNNAVWHAIAGTDDPGASLDTYTLAATLVDDAPVTGMYWDDDRGTDADVYYLRVVQADGAMAWVGPVWVEVARAGFPRNGLSP